jgi:hypothetical protein
LLLEHATILNNTAKGQNMLGARAMRTEPVLAGPEFGIHEVSDALEYHLVVELGSGRHKGYSSVVVWEIRVSFLEEGHETGIGPVRRV